MNKIAVALFLAAALVAPALADGMELIPKLGYLFSPEMKMDNDYTSSDESTFSIGAEMFFDMQNNFFLGAGLMWANYHKLNNGSDDKIGFTNVYAAAKYKCLVNGDDDNPFFLYPLAQLGFGMASYDLYGPYAIDAEVEGGFYWGLGVGAEFQNVILEFIYGCNYATMKTRLFKEDFTYTAFRINVGYKFDL